MALSQQELLRRVNASNDDREIAAALIDLAARADRNPSLQEHLKKIKLRPPFERLEYMKPYNAKGSWRRAPANREYPSAAQAEFRLNTSKTYTELYGTKGTVDMLDGTRIPIFMFLAGERLRGRKFTSDEEKEQRERERTIERMVTKD